MVVIPGQDLESDKAVIPGQGLEDSHNLDKIMNGIKQFLINEEGN